jgi:hypothetical protein
MSDGNYEVLSPWADADPVPFRGITPRLTDLAGKKMVYYATVKGPLSPFLRLLPEN